MSARPRAWQRAETKPAPIDVLIARAQAGEYADLADAMDFAIRTGLVREIGADLVEDALGSALLNHEPVS